MKFLASKEDLTKAIKLMQCFLSSFERGDKLKNSCIIQCEGNAVSLQATDFKQAIMHAKVQNTSPEEDGRVRINFKKFSNIVKSLGKSEFCTLNSDIKAPLVIETGSGNVYKIDSEALDDYPDISITFPNDAVRINQQKIIDRIKKTIDFVSLDDSRPEFTTICTKCVNKQLIAVSTNCHTLAKSETHFIVPDFESFLIPGIVHNVLLNMDNVSATHFAIINESDISQKQSRSMLIDNDSIRMKFKEYSGKFPDFSRVIPSRFDFSVDVEKDELLKLLKNLLASLNKKERYLASKFIFNYNKLKIEGHGNNFTGQIEAKEIDCKTSSVIIGMNPTYLYNALNNLDSSVVRISIIDDDSPIVVTDEYGNDVFVIMPMQL